MKDKRILPVLTDEEMGKKVLAALNENLPDAFIVVLFSATTSLTTIMLSTASVEIRRTKND